MPELPDVELFKRYLDEHALDRKITGVVVGDARILNDLPEADFRARLEGNRLKGSRRHGKHLLVQLAKGGWLTYHFGMTGGFQWFDQDQEAPRYDRVRLEFKDGRLAYINKRMLGHVGLADDADRFIEAEGLGPDALDPGFDLEALSAALDSRRDVKSVLMDQARIAGIGNLYADEILFQALLHPKTPALTLDSNEREVLLRAIKEVLRTAIESGAGAEQLVERLPGHFLLPQRHEGGICPRCGHALAVLKAAGRTGYFCPCCQPEPV